MRNLSGICGSAFVCGIGGPAMAAHLPLDSISEEYSLALGELPNQTSAEACCVVWPCLLCQVTAVATAL
jgi:hypothetical protein